MNIQTEKQDNHTVRLTVEIDATRFEKSKKAAAKKLAKRVNIPGFRKGKAPYKIIVNYFGEGAIVEDAVEILGNEVYRDVLKEFEIEPYAPGSIEDFEIEPLPKFVFVVPLQPEVTLGDYRSVRLDYEEVTVTDEEVDEVLKNMQEQSALIEESHKPFAPGNRVVVDIHGELVDDDENNDEDDTADDDGEEAAAEVVNEDDVAVDVEDDTDTDVDDEDVADEDDDDHDHMHDHDGDSDSVVLHRHDAALILDEDREPAPGFAAAMVGAEVGESRSFELTYPDDEDEYGDLAGKRVQFYVDIKSIENVTLPSINDDFAARMSEEMNVGAADDDDSEEKEPMTLLELRIKVREDLQDMHEQNVKSEYAMRAVDEMVGLSTVSYPEEMVVDQIESMLDDFDQRLQQQRGMRLEDFLTLTGRQREDLYDDYREQAVATLERSLVLSEIFEHEEIAVSDESIDSKIAEMIQRFGMGQNEQALELFNTEGMRGNIRSDLMNEGLQDRIVEIARGQAPEMVTPAEEDAAETAAETEEVDKPEETPEEVSETEEGEST